jgi:hypothetical protein
MEFRWQVKERARTYISRMPESLQGQGGSQAMFNVAAVLMRGFSLDEADGMELLAEWNERHANPRWSPVELRHKLRDGAKADRAEGYLLREHARQSSSCSSSFSFSSSKSETRHHTSSHQTAQRPRSGTGPVPVEGAKGAEPQSYGSTPSVSHATDGTRLVPLPAGELALLSKKLPSCSCSSSPRSPTQHPASRYSLPAAPCTSSTTDRRTPPWPTFSPLTDEDCDRIAILRKVPGAAVELVRRAGLLGKAHYEGHDCFIMGEGRFAQARRFDGGLLPVQGGRKQSKAKNLPGSEGAFIGRKWAMGSRCPVLLVEGVIGLVEALAALMMARDCLDWTCLAAVSASSRFVRDAELLHALVGRKVHIIPDAGAAGQDAASYWMGELEDAGAIVQVEPVPLPIACKDLGDVVSRVYQSASPDDDIHFQGCLRRAPDDLREYLKTIFS